MINCIIHNLYGSAVSGAKPIPINNHKHAGASISRQP